MHLKDLLILRSISELSSMSQNLCSHFVAHVSPALLSFPFALKMEYEFFGAHPWSDSISEKCGKELLRLAFSTAIVWALGYIHLAPFDGLAIYICIAMQMLAGLHLSLALTFMQAITSGMHLGRTLIWLADRGFWLPTLIGPDWWLLCATLYFH